MASGDPSNRLVASLHEHNPWWREGSEAFDLPARAKSDFYWLVRPDEAASKFTEDGLLALVGRRGVGKTTLVESFVHHEVAERRVPPERFCYLPFDANPLYQLRSDEQLRRAVRYYEARVLGRSEADGPHFLLLDDVHRIEHPTKDALDGWGTVVGELLADPDRHVAVTATAAVQVERELDRAGVDADRRVHPLLPEKFRDYLYTVHPDLESDTYRLSPTSLRFGSAGLPAAVDRGDADRFLAELREKYDRVASVAGRIQSQVAHYLAMGGVISYAVDGAVPAASSLPPDAYDRLREDTRLSLYQEVPGFETIQNVADLERLCALAAERRGEPVRYRELADLFDVDRRTIATSYFPALAELYLLTPATEYDNSRPRSVALYLRDTGLVNALADNDPTDALDDYDLGVELATVAGYDHAMRLAYGMGRGAADRGLEASEDPEVSYWRGRDATVEYVFEVAETPVPVAHAARPGDPGAKASAVREFCDAYDAPVGFVATGDATAHEGVTVEDDVVFIPYWFYLLLC